MRRLVPALVFALLAVVVWRAATPIESQSSRQRLSVDGRFDLRLVSNGDVALLVGQDGRSGLAVFRSVRSGPFEPVEFVPSSELRDTQVYGLWATTHGFFAAQRSRESVPRFSRSVDGARWELIDSPAFDRPGDINDLVQLAGGDLMAVGQLRHEPTRTFSPAMWQSRDGLTWQRVPIIGALAEASALLSIAARATTVVVAGIRLGRPGLWRSDDAGESWTAVAGVVRQFDSVASAGGRFVGVADSSPLRDPKPGFGLSNDGRMWREVMTAGLLDDGLRFRRYQITKTASGIFIVGVARADFSKRLDWCYAAPATCANRYGTAVLHSASGDVWRAIDVDSLFGPWPLAFAVTDTKAGTVMAAATPGRIEIVTMRPASWPLLTPQPVPPLPALPPLATYKGSIAAATVYRYPKSIHCGGLDWLGEFNGQTWKLERQLVGGDPRALAAVPQFHEMLFGTMRLTAPDTIEYSVGDAGVVAVYRPTSEPMPGCL